MTKKELDFVLDENNYEITTFFNSINIDEDVKRRVYQAALLKIDQTKSSTEITYNEISMSKKIKEKIIYWLKTILWTWKWRYAVPIAGILLLTVFGFKGFGMIFNNNSLNVASEMSDNAANLKAGAPSFQGQKGVINEDENTLKNKELTKSVEPQLKSAALDSQFAAAKNHVNSDQQNESFGMTKIAHELTITLKVENIEESIPKLMREIKDLGGNVIESKEDTIELGHITGRVPEKTLAQLRRKITIYGEALDSNMISNDISNQYYEVRTKLEKLKTKAKESVDLLNKSKNADEISKIEESIRNTKLQIEDLNGQLNLFNNEINNTKIFLILKKG